MKKQILALALSVGLLFADEGQWSMAVEQEGITAAAVYTSMFEKEATYYYALPNKGIFVSDSSGVKLLTDETSGDQPEELQQTTNLLITGQAKTPSYLYAAGESGVYSMCLKGKGPYTWHSLSADDDLNVSNMVSTNEGVFILTTDNKLYCEEGTSLKEIPISADLIPGFEVVTPVRIGQERLFKDDSGEFPWLLLECSSGFVRKYMLLSLPLEDGTPTSFGKSLQESSEILYGEEEYFEYVKAISKGSKITLEAYNEYLTHEGIKDIKFPSGTVITDITAFNRAFPVYHDDRLDRFEPSLFIVTTTKGSYSFSLKELMKSDETLTITNDLDPMLCIFDPTPSLQTIYTGIQMEQRKQFVLNEKGIAVFEMPYVSPVLVNQTKNNKHTTISLTNKKLSLTFDTEQTGTIALMNLQGRMISSKNIHAQKSVTLSLSDTLAKGVYLMKLQTNQGTVTEKLILE